MKKPNNMNAFIYGTKIKGSSRLVGTKKKRKKVIVKC